MQGSIESRAQTALATEGTPWGARQQQVTRALLPESVGHRGCFLGLRQHTCQGGNAVERGRAGQQRRVTGALAPISQCGRHVGIDLPQSHNPGRCFLSQRGNCKERACNARSALRMPVAGLIRQVMHRASHFFFSCQAIGKSLTKHSCNSCKRWQSSYFLHKACWLKNFGRILLL